MYTIHNETLPNAPKTCEDIRVAFANEKIRKIYGHTKHDNPSVFYKGCVEDSNFAYCIFASDVITQKINSCIPIERRNYLMDATFKIVPQSCFKQLLIIYIEYMEQVRFF